MTTARTNPQHVFFRVVPTHYGDTRFPASTSTEPTGKPTEYIRHVRVYVCVTGLPLRPDDRSERWAMACSFQRYTPDGQWFIGHEAWHASVPTTVTLYRDGADKFDLTDRLDAFKEAYRAMVAQREATGEYQLYGRTRERLLKNEKVT